MADYENKEGLERDVAKLRHLYPAWKDAMKPHFKRWLKKPWSPHETTNVFVESSRADAYFNGHIMAVAFYTSLVITIILAVL